MHNKPEQRNALKNDKVPKNTASKEPDLFRRVKCKPRRRSDELAGKGGSSLYGQVQWAREACTE